MAKCKRKQRLLGKSIRRIRMRRNMTQRELANAIEGTGESSCIEARPAIVYAYGVGGERFDNRKEGREG